MGGLELAKAELLPPFLHVRGLVIDKDCRHSDHPITREATAVGVRVASWCRWVPAFAGMTSGDCPCPPVFPAKAGTQARRLGTGTTCAAMRDAGRRLA